LATGAMQVFEYQWGSSQNYQDHEMRLVVSGPDEVLGIIRNITERKKIEQQAIQAERLATLGRLSAALTHEINNPLQSIQTYLDLMLDFTLEPGEDKKFLQIMRQEVRRLNEITQRILNLASPQPTHRRRVFVVDLLREVLLLVNKYLQQHQIQVTLDFQEVLPILAAPDQLTQVFLNLVINAIEALPEYGQLHLTVYPEQAQVTISFVNNGPIIPPEILPHIFEPFFTTKPQGTGLGLWISHTLIQQHGGTLTVENLEHDSGVAFTINLPTISAMDLNND
jgi:signal transduction histidine kinase